MNKGYEKDIFVDCNKDSNFNEKSHQRRGYLQGASLVYYTKILASRIFTAMAFF